MPPPMNPPIDAYEVSFAKNLIRVMVLHCVNFPLPVVIEAMRQTLAELEQEAIAHSR
jgi:hypothetical protein